MAGGPLRYELAGGAHAAWDVSVRAKAGTARGRYFLAARTTDATGLLIEDAAMVAVGEKQWPDPGPAAGRGDGADARRLRGGRGGRWS